MPDEPADSAADDTAPASTEVTDPEPEDAGQAAKKARLEAAKRRYRATLRNEADSGGGGFSEDYYRSQKPPHWS